MDRQGNRRLTQSSDSSAKVSNDRTLGIRHLTLDGKLNLHVEMGGGTTNDSNERPRNDEGRCEEYDSDQFDDDGAAYWSAFATRVSTAIWLIKNLDAAPSNS